jgi:septum formation protein
MNLILASASPRRAEILRNAGFEFTVMPADADESQLSGEAPGAYVRRLAETKARVIRDSVASSASAGFVIGADTAVVVGNELLAKPLDAVDARRMLKLLSGRTHEVLTGIAVAPLPSGAIATEVETTRVTFLRLSENEIEQYIATGEPFDKAGGYGIQGLAGKFISRIEGCYFNVMGLPVSRLWQMLRGAGWSEKSQGGGK